MKKLFEGPPPSPMFVGRIYECVEIRCEGLCTRRVFANCSKVADVIWVNEVWALQGFQRQKPARKNGVGESVMGTCRIQMNYCHLVKESTEFLFRICPHACISEHSRVDLSNGRLVRYPIHQIHPYKKICCSRLSERNDWPECIQHILTNVDLTRVPMWEWNQWIK